MTMPTTHALDTSQGLVVFHIGMTIRKPHRPDLWAPVAAAMPRIIRGTTPSSAPAMKAVGQPRTAG